MTDPAEMELRLVVVDTGKRLHAAALSSGTSGNISVRCDGGFLITPTGIGDEALAPEQIVPMSMDGVARQTQWPPSSEWRFHRDIYRQRADIQAIVHTHSVYATAVACLHREIPAFHYMVAVAGASRIPCARYATFGTQALSDNIIASLGSGFACLLANHGLVAAGEDLAGAFRVAQEVEHLARIYIACHSIGTTVSLSDREMEIVLKKFKHYGKQRGEDE